MEIGLFFGSFNPIHTGHMIIANLALELAGLQEVWFVVSPQNPHKRPGSLLHEFDRYDMVEAAISDDYHFRACDIEFHMTKPAYTAETLAHLSDRHPGHTFRLILGEDNLHTLSRWKNHQALFEYGLIVYPRPGCADKKRPEYPNVEFIEAPMIDISATLIRKLIQNGKSIRYLVPEPVRQLIEARKHYL
ncbi:MAG: nicotinate (nicotinamide) nucleotide adenylyltransferase [Cyclobacteriaceae bacterium]|nr:nicotinate (nicotinamide) nucleotide adenylyltransferase [Cyclobacteriaceae bacterium]